MLLTCHLDLRLVALLALTTAAPGCAVVVDETNQHAACVLPGEPDTAVMVNVDHGCAPCGDNLEMGCTVELDGDELIVESTFTYEESRQPCDLACQFISSNCQTSDPVPAGSYTIRYGDRTATLEVPSEGEAPCFPRS